MTDIFDDKDSTISIEEELKSSYMDYAMSVIVGRALPDARDGLKPVHRRTLFAMNVEGNDWNRASPRQFDGSIDITSLHHAISGNIRINNGFYA